MMTRGLHALEGFAIGVACTLLGLLLGMIL
jgi:hypothetical protein